MGDGAGSAVILASASAIRKQLLRGAGLDFTVEPATIDERAATASLIRHTAGAPIAELAEGLAELKALDVSRRNRGVWVIGADQMLELDGEILSKAASVADARLQLQRLRGRIHTLHSGVAVARDGKTAWRFVQSASLCVRDFSDAWLDVYLAQAGEALTRSVGAYQLESVGVQLFERIEGDYFTILGLPLLPLLGFLRTKGILVS